MNISKKSRSYLIETDPNNTGPNKRFPISLEGIFFRCYNDTAKLVSDAMGYSLNKSDKIPNLLMVGFPKTSLNIVLDVLDKKYSGVLEKHIVDDCLVYYSLIPGATITIPDVEINGYVVDKTIPEEVFRELIRLNLNELTPMQALQILGSMKNKCIKFLNFYN